MPRHRLPKAKALTEGKHLVHPERHRNRKEPQNDTELGDPPDWMGGEQRLAWRTFQREIPWLNASHRGVVEIATIIRARLMAGEECGVQALNLLRQCLGSMGATPSDASKVTLPDNDEEEDDLLD